jgi:hypothetical protein
MSDQIKQFREEHGLFRNIPRSLRGAVERRLRTLEADRDEFDRSALEMHGRLKRLYSLLHLKPGDWARATLFEKPPAESPRAALRRLADRRNNPVEAAGLIRRYRIPFLLAEAALGSLSEPVAVALIETMPGEELLARLPLLQRRGLLQGAVRDALLTRFQRMRGFSHERFPYPKIESVVRNSNLDRQLSAAAFALVKDESTAGAGSLTGDTALLVDVSMSMPRVGGGLELAAYLGWHLDRALDPGARLIVYRVGVAAEETSLRRGSELDQWRTTFSTPIPQTAGTALGAGVETLRQSGQRVSRLIVITDGCENRAPRLVSALERYRIDLGQRPVIQLVQPASGSTQLAGDLRNAQVPFGVFKVDAHLAGIDSFLPALRSSAGQSVTAQVLAFPDPDPVS